PGLKSGISKVNLRIFGDQLRLEFPHRFIQDSFDSCCKGIAILNRQRFRTSGQGVNVSPGSRKKHGCGSRKSLLQGSLGYTRIITGPLVKVEDSSMAGVTEN